MVDSEELIAALSFVLEAFRASQSEDELERLRSEQLAVLVLEPHGESAHWEVRVSRWHSASMWRSAYSFDEPLAFVDSRAIERPALAALLRAAAQLIADSRAAVAAEQGKPTCEERWCMASPEPGLGGQWIVTVAPWRPIGKPGGGSPQAH